MASPIFSNLNNDNPTFTTGGAPVLLDTGTAVTITDTDNPTNFNGSTAIATVAVALQAFVPQGLITATNSNNNATTQTIIVTVNDTFYESDVVPFFNNPDLSIIDANTIAGDKYK